MTAIKTASYLKVALRKETMNKDEIDCLACPINMVCDTTITFGSIYCQQARASLRQANAQQLQNQICTAIKEMESCHHTIDFGTGYNAFIKKMREISGCTQFQCKDKR